MAAVERLQWAYSAAAELQSDERSRAWQSSSALACTLSCSLHPVWLPGSLS
jgi:hypothetical protein